MELQKTFKESYVNTLRDAVISGQTLALYAQDKFEVDSKYVKRLRNVYAPEGLNEKLLETVDDDFKSAVVVYEAYKDLSPLIASTEAFWVYLTHVDLFEYTQKKNSLVFTDKISDSYILDHWFAKSGLLRNTIATLWWSVHNTIDPQRDNPYELTEILFKNFTLRVVTFGSYPLIRHREAMIGILSFLKDNPDLTSKKFEISGLFLSKYFNRLGAVKCLTYLNRDYFYDMCEKLKSTILSIKTRDQLQDESLFDIVF